MEDNIIKKIQVKIEKENKILENSSIKVKIFDFHYNEGVMLIVKDGSIDKVFILKASSQYQVDIYKEKMKLENGLFIDDLVAWIYNLYNPVRFLYEFVGGSLNGKIMTREEIEKLAIGKTNNIQKYRKNERKSTIKELDNQPIIKDYLGPIFNRISAGIIYLKYETQETYNEMSK